MTIANFDINPVINESTTIYEMHVDFTRRVYVRYIHNEGVIQRYSYWKSFDLDQSNQAWEQFVGKDNLEFMNAIRSWSKEPEWSRRFIGNDGMKFVFNNPVKTTKGAEIDQGYVALSFADYNFDENFITIGEPINDGWDKLVEFASQSEFKLDEEGIVLYGDFDSSPHVSVGGLPTYAQRNDSLLGSIYDDSLFGLLGSDSLWGRAGSDDLYGGYGNDKLYGEIGNDYLYGEQGNDELHGGDGDDYLDGGLGKDLLVGGKGNDTYLIDNSGDRIDDRGASTDVDTVLVPIFLSYTLPTNIEDGELSGKHNSNLTGNLLANDLTGNVGNNRLDGGLGNDNIDGGGGNDTLIGGAGSDEITGGLGNDVIIGGLGNDDLVGGTGKDLFRFTSSVITGASGQGTDEIIDFQKGIDKIQIQKSGFKVGTAAITSVVISNSMNNTFGSGANFHFNTATGDLFFRGQTTPIADVLGVTSLSASDFSLI
jgi:Ca2+-binding RTX toxin-like protein